MTKKKAVSKTLQPVINELHKAFDKFNQVFFNNELPQVVIAVQSRGKRKAFGWFTPYDSWEDKEGNGMHEITITAETIGNRDYMDIMRTLHHEMIHLYCHMNDIKETSRGGTWHNKKFKEVSEQFGFVYPHEKPDPKIGYSAIEFTKETANKVKFWNINGKVFEINRKEMNGAGSKKKSNIVKWECPCGTIVRSSKPEINIICGDCEGKFEKAD